LYGEKIQFEELYHQDEDWQQLVVSLTEKHPEITDELNQLEQKLVNRHTGINRSLWFYLSMNRGVNRLRRKVRKLLTNKEDSKKLITRLLKLKSICKLGINEILFSYWHILHLPLFIMLVISGFTHVIVVHFY
jgi:chromosome segregation ATPase